MARAVEEVERSIAEEIKGLELADGELDCEADLAECATVVVTLADLSLWICWEARDKGLLEARADDQIDGGRECRGIS